MKFDSPWALLIILLIPVMLWLGRLSRGSSLRFSSTRHASQLKPSLKQRLIWLPVFLRVLALLALSFGLARPQYGHEIIRDKSQGIAIEMVVDRSGSMKVELEFDGKHMTRLDIVKNVFKQFIVGNDDNLQGRPNDLIGMVTFARYADTVCPLTLGHGALARFLETVNIVKEQSEDGTAIGEGIAVAAARLKSIDDELAKKDGSYKIKSKIIILLTDGENNAGKRDPMQAARIAKEWGIKIYTIGVGGEGVMSVNTLIGIRKQAVNTKVDDRMLREIAETTGGIFQLATDADSLIKVYEEIDRLEKSEIESERYMNYTELFWYFALAAIAILMVELLLSNTVFRKVP